MAGFKDYLDEDKRYEILMTSHGRILLEWNSNDRELESAQFCPTPEVMKGALLNALEGYLEYKTTLCNRNLTDDERQMIEAQVEKGPSIDILVEISALFEVSLDYIIMGRQSQDDFKKQLHSVIQNLSKLAEEL